MSPDNESLHAHEPLLLPALIEAHKGNSAGDGTITRIIRGLMSSPMTDAQRAGERLRVFGWELPGEDDVLRWCYRVVGEETGRDLVAVHAGRARQASTTCPAGCSACSCRSR